jgi:hypothetical protein
MIHDDIFNEVCSLLEEGAERLQDTGNWDSDIEKGFPKRCAVGVVDVDFGITATDRWFDIKYSNADEMKAEILRAIEALLSRELLELFRSEDIKNLTFRIGPDALSGENFFAIR